MNNKNELIYSVREVLGDETDTGFILTCDTGLEVPNFLNKDGNIQYPEIRIFPFISNKKLTRKNYKYNESLRNKRKVYKAIFQIDIRAKSIVDVNTIHQNIENRIEDFTNIDTILYNDVEFKKNESNIYYNTILNTNDFKIINPIINNCMLTKVFNINELVENTWFMNTDGLYLKTNQNIESIKIISILNGLSFSNGDTCYTRGITNMRIKNDKNLSNLEKNEVERNTFELEITYYIDRFRKIEPIVKDINISDLNG